MQIETVSLLEVIAAARARQASLVPETAGYVMLALGRAMVGVPMRLDLERLLLSTEGQVSFDGPRQAVQGGDACAALRRLLAELLELSNGYAPALRAASTRTSSNDSVEPFFAEVAKALIPINRAAAKRALSRLARETAKAARSGKLVRPSFTLEDASRASEQAHAPTPKRRASNEVASEHSTPSPGEHSATLTPTFLDSDVQASHEGVEQPTFREAVMRDVLGFLAKDVRKSGPAPDEIDLATPSLEPNARQRDASDVTSLALDLLSRGSDGARASMSDDASRAERRSRVPKRFVPKREKVVARLDDVAPPYAAASVETLLDRFTDAREEAASLRQLESSLGALGSLHMTPLTNAASVEDASPSADVAPHRDAVGPAEEGLESAPWLSVDVELGAAAEEASRLSATPSGQSFERGNSSVPPLFLERMPRRTGKVMLGVGAALASLAAAVAGLAVLRPELLGRGAAAKAPEVCSADIVLRNLPEHHEVLWRLGNAPLASRALPRGVRLELVATAPDHQPRRILVERDAAWDPSGALALSATLEPGAASSWPSAPAGDVGGVGPAGQVTITATPSSTELWLVVAAGSSHRAPVSLPCEEAAHLLVVDPTAPSTPSRVDLEPEVLRAAARTGEAEIAVHP
ncbi:MAG: hypothetical protein FJ095_02030 [Deltaproteobacteria bacterium]|nr:hypothetical protein [Deltaproteobacteria bacterium]